jgi:hypothetical protein
MNSDPEVMEKAKIALYTDAAAVVALGAEYGYSFTEAEADEALIEFLRDGELSDFELELVSAGSQMPPSDISANANS